MPYFFASSISGDSVSITGPDARHLAGPLRARPGQVISVLDSEAGRALSVLLRSVSRSLVLGEVVGAEAHAPEPALRVCMSLALLPASALAESLARCTELGAWSFVLISAARSVARVGSGAGSGSRAPSGARSRSARWETVCREAAMLAGRFRVPSVAGPVSFAEALDRFPAGSAWVLDRRADTRLADALVGLGAGGSAVSSSVAGGSEADGSMSLFIGPEGGWSEEELALAGERVRGLGRRNLRAPNAAAAALTLALAAAGDL